MKWKSFFVIFTAFVLVGCGGMSTKNEEKRPANNGDKTIENTRYEGDQVRKSRDNDRNRNNNIGENVSDRLEDRNRHSNNRASNNRQDEYDVSKEAADKIVAEIPDIERAYVLTSNRNAYVAAQLNRNDSTEGDHIAKNDRQNNSTGMNVRNTNDRNAKSRTVNEGDANDRGTDNHMANRRDIDTNRYDDDRQVESDEVSDQVKNKIADIVQDVDNDIDNVYVSTSPDFLDLANDYTTDMDNGKPVRGFFDQLGNTIERIFPQNKR